jgi:hypothetical protein
MVFALAASMLVGCAEINKRGGVVAEAEDAVLFVAHTKSHRLFRSYLLAGVLIAAARQGGHNEADKASILANMASVEEVATEAYNCLYPDAAARTVLVGVSTTIQGRDAVGAIGTPAAIAFTPPALCQFFDEKMARLDYALFRLALSALFNRESNSYLTDIRDKLIGKIPVLSASAKAAIYANKAVNEATTIVDDLLNLSFASAGPVVTLLPLYRDSLELNMWLIIDNLTSFCADPQSKPGLLRRDAANQPIASYDISFDKVCDTMEYAKAIMNNGNGYLPQWRDFVRNMNYATRDFEAFTPHFYLITMLVRKSCASFIDKDKCALALQKELIPGAFQPNFLRGGNDRYYSASRRLPSMQARKPVPSLPSNAGAPRAREPEATGSIPKPPSATVP